MGISLKGNDINFQYWVFDIDGRDWIAVNQSTQTPLKIQFQGRYGNWGTGNPLSKATGFDIISSTVSKTGPDGEKQGVVEWVWNGTRYKSVWGLYPGTEIIAGDPAEGIEAIWDYQLTFTTGIPYDGPAGGTVGGGVVSQKTVEAQKTESTAPSGGGTAPSGGGTAPSGGGGLTRSAFTTTTTTTGGGTPAAVPGVEVAGVDWPGLVIKLGAAYLLLS